MRKKIIAEKVNNDIEPLFEMPHQVKQWIDRAASTMKHQQSKIDDLTKENNELKSYKKWAEARILRSDNEE
jgi:uncharacterized protein YoxC